MDQNRQINISLNLFDILISLSLIILNDLTLNLPPDIFNLFLVMSFITVLVSLVCDAYDEILLQVATSCFNIGVFAYFISIVLINTIEN